jgi:hypothetical protein
MINYSKFVADIMRTEIQQNHPSQGAGPSARK